MDFNSHIGLSCNLGRTAKLNNISSKNLNSEKQKEINAIGKGNSGY